MRRRPRRADRAPGCRGSRANQELAQDVVIAGRGVVVFGVVARELVKARGPARGEVNAAALTDTDGAAGAGRADSRFVVRDAAARDREGALEVVIDTAAQGIAADAADGCGTAHGSVRGEGAVADGERAPEAEGEVGDSSADTARVRDGAITTAVAAAAVHLVGLEDTAGDSHRRAVRIRQRPTEGGANLTLATGAARGVGTADGSVGSEPASADDEVGVIAVRYGAAARAGNDVQTRPRAHAPPIARDRFVPGEHTIRHRESSPALIEDGAAVGNADEDGAARGAPAIPAHRPVAGERAVGDCRCSAIPDGAALAVAAFPAEGS